MGSVAMKSYWSIVCNGSSSKVVIRKLERVLHVEVIIEKTQRVILDDRKLEVVDFLINDSSIDDWSDFVVYNLKISARLSSRWSICIESDNLKGFYYPLDKDEIPSISGLNSATWQISNNKYYKRQGLFEGSGLDMW